MCFMPRSLPPRERADFSQATISRSSASILSFPSLFAIRTQMSLDLLFATVCLPILSLALPVKDYAGEAVRELKDMSEEEVKNALREVRVSPTSLYSLSVE